MTKHLYKTMYFAIPHADPSETTMLHDNENANTLVRWLCRPTATIADNLSYTYNFISAVVSGL